ncbi:hypothetical protein [Acinetobacter venetianus]|uniref:hypothetical protein n=1 Tax=Acinetobacter venetianus TaxID=52133 RepID=UPI0021504F10|nr:hypothetical protein [Acinetobacter venetianus]MCR4529794.1 hypothetical protein [Acinetobacter venetianus]
MSKLKIFLIVSLILVGCSNSENTPENKTASEKVDQVESQPQAFKAEELTNSEEKRILDLAKNLKTKDGSSVLETIQYAEKNTKNKFKAGEFETTYNRDGSLEGVALNYWISDSREPEDAFLDIGWTLTPDRKGFLSVKESSPTLSDEEIDNLTVTHLMNGKNDFLKYVDQLEH